MISVCVTAYKEPESVRKLLEVIVREVSKKDDVLVACPDKETQAVVKTFKNVKLVKDDGKGKPAALNKLFKIAKGKYTVLTDGDCVLKNGFLKHLVAPFKDNMVGAVSGRPVPTNPRNSMYGFWAHFLYEKGAHKRRLEADKKSEFSVLSGYLCALRKGLVKHVNEEALVDDGFISYVVWNSGYKIAYAPQAKVYVTFPTSIKDFIKQKRRTMAGYLQLKNWFGKIENWRKFSTEVKEGLLEGFKYCKNIKEFLYFKALLIVRLLAWILAFIDIKILRRNLKQIWVRVETTK